MKVKNSKEEILKERAQALASGGIKQEDKQGALPLVVFTLAKEQYAIESTYVREVYSLKELTYIPCVPSFVKGVIQVRRKIYSIIDLRILFDLSRVQRDKESKALILEQDNMAFGIIVEEIKGVASLFASELQQPLPSMTGIHLEFVKGISKDCLVVLDGRKLLNSSTVVVEKME